MNRRPHSALLLLALATTFIPAAAATAAPYPADLALARACGTAAPTPEEMMGVEAAVERWLGERGAEALSGQIRVAFHVITSGSEGNVPDAQIQAQITELNRNFGGTDGGANTAYTFVLTSVDRTNNRRWFKMTPGSNAERQAKNALAVDPAHRLNIYTCKPGQNLLGWAVFPWSAPESDRQHGIVVHYGSLPGGSIPRFNLGRTASHEVGHYLGLYHTFQGGCNPPGDYVDDTPAEGTSTSGCPEGKDTCSSPGFDPIHNYMDYSDDACYTQFTSGQDGRMDSIVPTYRPSLLGAPVAPEPGPAAARWLAAAPAVAPGLALRAAPNPFRASTELHFTLRAGGPVSVRVYDVAGRLAATLVEGTLPAGEHRARFLAGERPAGVYVVRLESGGAELNRSVVLIR